MQNLIIRITQKNNNLINDSNIGCFIVNDDLPSEFIAECKAKASENNKLLLAIGTNAEDLYKQKLVDGVILDTSKESNPKKLIKDFQQNNKGAIVGVISRNRRHEAMLVSECEPDFIIFRVWQNGLEENTELLQWYSDFFLIQSAALIEEDVDFTKLPADFAILTDISYKIFVAK